MTSSHFYYLAVAHVVFSACLVCYNVQNIPPRCRPRESDESAGGKAIVIFLSLFVELFYSFLVWLMSFNFVCYLLRPFPRLPCAGKKKKESRNCGKFELAQEDGNDQVMGRKRGGGKVHTDRTEKNKEQQTIPCLQPSTKSCSSL